MFADITQMFAWAEKHQPWRALLVNGNPTNLIEINKHDPPQTTKRNEATSFRRLNYWNCITVSNRWQPITTPTPAGQKYEGIRPLKKESQLAFWISQGTLCRMGELLQGKWKIVDLEQRTWFLPGENVKGTRGK